MVPNACDHDEVVPSDCITEIRSWPIDVADAENCNFNAAPEKLLGIVNDNRPYDEPPPLVKVIVCLGKDVEAPIVKVFTTDA